MQERFETFTVLISSISRSIRRLKTEEMAEFNLKSPHVSCLYYLYKAQPMTAAELCEVCDEDKAAVSRSILYLEQNGFLVRCEPGRSPGRSPGLRPGRSAAAPTASGGKHYRTPLVLTEKGQEAATRLVRRIDSVLDAVADGVSEEDRVILYRALKQIDRNLAEMCEQGSGGE